MTGEFAWTYPVGRKHYRNGLWSSHKVKARFTAWLLGLLRFFRLAFLKVLLEQVTATGTAVRPADVFGCHFFDWSVQK